MPDSRIISATLVNTWFFRLTLSLSTITINHHSPISVQQWGKWHSRRTRPANKIVNTPTSQDPNWTKLKFVNLKNMKSHKVPFRSYNKPSEISPRSWLVWGIIRNYWLGSKHLIGMLIWYLRMLRRYVFVVERGNDADLFLFFISTLDIYAYLLHCSAFALFHIGITSYTYWLESVSRPEWSPSTLIESMNDPKHESIISVSTHHPTRHTTDVAFTARTLRSIARFAHDFVRMTDVGRNTKRKRKETSQQRSIYLVCLPTPFALSSFHLGITWNMNMDVEWMSNEEQDLNMDEYWWIGKCS